MPKPYVQALFEFLYQGKTDLAVDLIEKAVFEHQSEFIDLKRRKFSKKDRSDIWQFYYGDVRSAKCLCCEERTIEVLNESLP